MKLSIKVKPNSKKESIEPGPAGTDWIINVKEPAREGKANTAILKALSKRLKISKNSLRIILGKNSRNKIIEVL